MSLEGTPLTIVYNGEVYNHQALRNEFQFDKSRYRTTSDTETILAGYSNLREQVVPHLRGMFAFAIYNEQERSLFIVRDRLGIKPLYYYQSDGLFAFASEIKALLQHPEIQSKVNVNKLTQQLTLKYTLDDETFYEGIHKLLPGHSLSLRNRQDRKQEILGPFVHAETKIQLNR